jgi:micrococcal nuclease
MYEYKAIATKVIDGDTVDLYIDLGFHIRIELRIRMAHINAPEIRSKDPNETTKGLKTKLYLIERIEGKEIIVRTFKDKTEKFGRILAVVLLDGVDINAELISKGLAVKY